MTDWSPGEGGVSARVRHLGLALTVTAVLLLIGALVGYLVRGGAGALGVAAGVALVAGSYTASTLAIGWADSVNPRLVFPVGMGMFVIKFSLLGGLLIVVGATDWAGKVPMAIGIVAAVVAWTGTQIWWTVHHVHPYVSVRRSHPHQDPGDHDCGVAKPRRS